MVCKFSQNDDWTCYLMFGAIFSTGICIFIAIWCYRCYSARRNKRELRRFEKLAEDQSQLSETEIVEIEERIVDNIISKLSFNSLMEFQPRTSHESGDTSISGAIMTSERSQLLIDYDGYLNNVNESLLLKPSDSFESNSKDFPVRSTSQCNVTLQSIQPNLNDTIYNDILHIFLSCKFQKSSVLDVSSKPTETAAESVNNPTKSSFKFVGFKQSLDSETSYYDEDRNTVNRELLCSRHSRQTGRVVDERIDREVCCNAMASKLTVSDPFYTKVKHNPRNMTIQSNKLMQPTNLTMKQPINIGTYVVPTRNTDIRNMADSKSEKV